MKKSDFAINATKATTKATRTTATATAATATAITDDMTLNELIRFARNDAVEKPKTTPKFGTLRKKANCVASHHSDDHRSSLFVYDNGFAAYETYGKTTAIDLDKISNVKYETTRDDLGMGRSDLDSEWLGDLPWTVALALLGEDQVTHNLLEDRAHELIEEGDYDENENATKKLNKPVFAAHIDGPETAYIRKETRNEIKKVLSKAYSKMSVKQEEAFKFYYNQGMTEIEIGNELGISQRAVSYRLEAAKQILHECAVNLL